MKQEIIFYEVDEELFKAIGPIVLKILDDNKRAIIYVSDLDKLKRLDEVLWTFGRNKFVPHATIHDKDFVPSTQPILLTNVMENSNQADYLIFLDEPEIEFTKQFSRIFYFFEFNNNCQKILPTKSYKKINGKWLAN